ncbi:MAG: redoxin domain-containing protein, partial [Rhodobacterales bacterium]|nr:redoxin domain-containing protein [Rhodobacterales bacterium]
MLSLLLALSAFAADHKPEQMGWYHIDRGEYSEARSAAHQSLSADSSDFSAHRLNAAVHSRMGQFEEHHAAMEAWHSEVNTPASAIALSAGISKLRTDDHQGCDQLAELLDGLPDEAAIQYIAQRIRLDAAQRCDLDVDAVKERMKTAPEDNPAAIAFAVYLRSADPLDDAYLADLNGVLTDHALRARGIAFSLWVKDRAMSPSLKPARKSLMASAITWSNSDDPVYAHYGAQVLQAAGSKKAEDAAAHALELRPSTAATSRLYSEVINQVYEADQRPTHELALAGLDALAPKVADDADATAVLLQLRADRLEGMGRVDEAIEARRGQLLGMDDPGNAGNGWAYEASLRGEHLDDALTLVEAALAGLAKATWNQTYGLTFAEWSERQDVNLSNYQDTRGWILYKLDRPEEAVEALTAAARANPSGVVYAHLGLAHAALNQDGLAFAFLSTSITQGIQEPDLAAEVVQVLKPLFARLGAWQPDGVDGYLASLVEEAEETGEEAATAAESPAGHSLIGQELPISVAKAMEGGDLSLQHDGILVIDLWATWCGPCVQGMPHLQSVAKEYADQGVRVVGLSVDDKQAKVTKFFRGATVDYELGWISKTGF